MTINELQSKIVAAKNFLNSEVVRIKTNESQISNYGFREIGDRLDMIHEWERVGIRNLDDVETRRASRLITQLEAFSPSSN